MTDERYNEYEVIIEQVHLSDNFTVYIDAAIVGTNKYTRMEQHKKDFTFPPGSSVEEEMTKLADCWRALIGKKIKWKTVTTP